MLKQALDLWPEEIDVSILVYTHKEKNRYSVKGLYELHESISSTYDNNAIDFIMMNIHWSILRVVHKSAGCMSRINMESLRAEAIKEQLDSLLDKIRAGGSDEFGGDVVELVDQYFLAN